MDFKQYRKEKGLTQTELGRLLGVSPAFVSNIENSKAKDIQLAGFERVLKYALDPRIDTALTTERLKSVRKYGLSYKKASKLIGGSVSIWSNLATGGIEITERWTKLVNALLIELAEGSRPALDLTPSGDIEIVQPTVLTPEPEAPMVDADRNAKGLIPFNYNNNPVIVKEHRQDLWICVRDICAVINHRNITNALSLIDDSELEYFKVDITDRGVREVAFTTYTGMLQLFARTRVEGAKPFQDWVYREVLPTVMKTGQYQAQNIQINDPLSQAIMIGQALQTFGKEIQAMQARELVREQKIANLEQAAQQVKYLEIAKPDRSEVLEIFHSELLEQKAKEKIEQLNHYRQRKDLEKRVSDVAWMAIKAHGGDHGQIIKDINKRIKMAIRGAHGYAIGRERYQDQDFAMAYQVVAMVEKEIGDFPKQGEIDFGKQ